MAGMYGGMTTVGLFDSLGQDAMQFICQQTKLKTIFVDKGLVKQICEWKQSEPAKMLHLENLVVIGSGGKLKDDIKEAAEFVDVKLMTYEDLVDIG